MCNNWYNWSNNNITLQSNINIWEFEETNNNVRILFLDLADKLKNFKKYF